jgi:hypothetical protein
MKRFLLCLLAGTFAQFGAAQTRYLVKFKDKGDNPFSISTPSGYLSARAISRRANQSIAVDSTDLPVTPRYIDSVRLAGAVTILNVSKWLNQVSIQTTDAAALAKINSFPFVRSATAIAARMNSSNAGPAGKLKGSETSDEASRVTGITENFFQYGQSFNQVHIHNGEFLHNIGLRGQTKVISLLDAGFFNYTTLDAFDSVNANGQVLGTWDFVARQASVVEDHTHGMQCFSIIAANIPGQFVGTAPKANFYLFRSEDAGSEYPIEEHNWVCAAERADSVGTDVISSSLGYNTFDGAFDNAAYNHTYAEMNGNTTMVVIGADLAAKKGMLVVNSAGNEGSSAWKYIASPADGDSVLAVGAVNTAGQVAAFSSYGPSSDGQVKPDVASVGVNTVIQNSGNTVGTGNGTSYAAPNMAGLATCLWQGFPEVNNMRIINALRLSSSIATSPNDRIGYGIPDMKKAVFILLKELVTSSSSTAANGCKTTIQWTSKDIAGMKYELQRAMPMQTVFTTVGSFDPSRPAFGQSSYTWTDSFGLVTSGGPITYRIRQVIDTAAASFSADFIDTLEITPGAACITTGINPVNPGDGGILIVPNPAPGRFTLKMTSAAPVEKLVIRIINGKGQLVAQEQRSKTAGPANFEFPIPHLASGKYYVMVYNGEKLLATKELIKL